MYKFSHIVSYANQKKSKLKDVNFHISQVDFDEEKNPYINITLEKEYEEETFIFTKTKSGIFIEWFINGVLYNYDNVKTQLEAINHIYLGR